ncbi:MAG: hypothetical protein JO210_13985 [Acidobacteriaceae bacterium]|nr:hypothetical protein [Acidobacteriaceae bacterium]
MIRTIAIITLLLYPLSNSEGIGASASPAASAPNSGASRQRTVIPAGTTFTVSMIDGIDSTKTSSGQRFRASIDDPVVVGNEVIIPRGANCTVQVVQVQQNKELAIKLYDVTVGGKPYDVAAGYAQLQAEGTSKTKKGVRRSAVIGGLGAAIGGIAGGGKGAAIGAVSGVGLGAISGAMAKGKTLNVPPETRLSFQLTAPLPVG